MTAPGGPILIHEHVYCRVGSRAADAARAHLRSELYKARVSGISAIVDVTPYVSPQRYSDMVTDVGLTVVSCAGFYMERRVPAALRAKDHKELTDYLMRRIRREKPGILKIASNGAPRTKFERAAFPAVAAAHRYSGLPIMVHSIRGAEDQFAALVAGGASPESIILSHVEMGLKGRGNFQVDEMTKICHRLLDAGAFICFTDLVATTPYGAEARGLLRSLVEHGYARQMLISGDISWTARRGQFLIGPNPARQLGYAACHTVSRDLLAREGLTPKDWEQMTVHNPRALLGWASVQ